MENSQKPIPPYDSAHFRARLTIIFLALNIVLDLIALGSGFMEIGLLSRAQEGGTITDTEAEANDTRQAIIGGLQLLTFVLTAIFFLMWIHRAHRNLPALGARDLKFTPNWAVGWFFVPFMNLFRPVQVVTEIWKASSPETSTSDETAWKSKSTSPVIWLWWAVWIIAGIVGQFAARLALRAETLETILISSWATFISDGIDMVAAVLAIIVVSNIDKMQEARAAQTATPGSPPPQAADQGSAYT